MGQAAHPVGLGGSDFVAVCLFLTRGTGVAAVGGVTMSPTVGSAAVVLAVAGLVFTAAIKVAICAWVASAVA